MKYTISQLKGLLRKILEAVVLASLIPKDPSNNTISILLLPTELDYTRQHTVGIWHR